MQRMIRKIIVPRERTIVLELPKEFVGKEVEVLAFEVKDGASARTTLPSTLKKSERLQQIRDTFAKYQVDAK